MGRGLRTYTDLYFDQTEGRTWYIAGPRPEKLLAAKVSFFRERLLVPPASFDWASADVPCRFHASGVWLEIAQLLAITLQTVSSLEGDRCTEKDLLEGFIQAWTLMRSDILQTHSATAFNWKMAFP